MVEVKIASRPRLIRELHHIIEDLHMARSYVGTACETLNGLVLQDVEDEPKLWDLLVKQVHGLSSGIDAFTALCVEYERKEEESGRGKTDTVA